MNIASIALVVAAVGVNFGWQPSKEDPQAYEVLMQVEPELVDVMAEGTTVPIESHVPKEVAPIRNIRVVVGNEKLPRTLIAAKVELKPASDRIAPGRIVRGQEPIEHTTNFQADAWGASSPNRQFDQRGATIGGAPTGAAETNPWTVENAQQAVSDAGNSLRNSTSSSIEQVNQQFSQTGQDMYNKTKDAASDFGNQLQNITGMDSQSPAPTGAAPAGQRYTPAPPLASPQSVAPTAGGWTSMNPALAPPRLATPPLPSGVRIASSPSSVRTSAGPSFPPPPTTDASQQRSLLTTAPQGNNREADDPWDSAPGNPATIGSDADGVGMVPVQPRMRTAAANSQQLPPPPATSAGPTAPPLDERYRSATGNGADEWANFGRPQGDVFNDPRMPAASQRPQQPDFAAQQHPQQQQPFAGQGVTTQPGIGAQPPTIPTVAVGQPAAAPEEVPWKPLLAVSLALAGSIGANFYLGMSYAEARHRYRTLVAKTTHAFEKKAGLAA